MEQEPSVISSNSSTSGGGGSGSIDSKSYHIHDQFQRCDQVKRNDNVMAASRFKGVISQPNGHWGAQIYVNHQRIWLGTFKSEKEAAMAYDSAAIKLRNGDSHRNFPWTSTNVQEPHFQCQFSAEEVLVMIKDGSYPSKFADFLKAQFRDGGCSFPTANPDAGTMGRKLFQKELTPSDVGKLNRLVIPKKFAVKYLPSISDELEQNEGVTGVQDTDLYFYDRSRRTWKFRYCYWRSSQSYVFTRGWNRFVKEKGLRAKDVVVFSVLGSNYMIDIKYNDEASGAAVEDAFRHQMELGVANNNSFHNNGVDLSSSIAGCDIDVMKGEEQEEEEGDAFLQTENYLATDESVKKKPKGLKLFGVQIV